MNWTDLNEIKLFDGNESSDSLSLIPMIAIINKNMRNTFFQLIKSITKERIIQELLLLQLNLIIGLQWEFRIKNVQRIKRKTFSSILFSWI